MKSFVPKDQSEDDNDTNGPKDRNKKADYKVQKRINIYTVRPQSLMHACIARTLVRVPSCAVGTYRSGESEQTA